MMKLLSAMLFLVLWLTASLALAEPDCFRREDNRHISYDVFQISGPPPYSKDSGDYADAFLTYPASDYATISIRTILTESPGSGSGLSFRKHYLLWANRCIFMEGITPDIAECRNTRRTKGNGYPGMTANVPLQNQLRSAFSTYRHANACTTLSALRVLGEGETRLRERANAEGLELILDKRTNEQLWASATTVSTGTGLPQTYLIDKCIVEPVPMAEDAAGVVLDYEVWDDRTPIEALSYLASLQDIVRSRGKTLIVATNPLPRAPNGIDSSNAAKILATVDAFAPTVATGGAAANSHIGVVPRQRQRSPFESYQEQLQVLTNQGRAPLSPELRRKLLWNVSLYDLSLDEAAQLRNEFVREKYRGIMISRNFVKQGGACNRPANQVIACLTMGECNGSFGAKR